MDGNGWSSSRATPAGAVPGERGRPGHLLCWVFLLLLLPGEPRPLTLTLPTDVNECVTALHTCSRGENCVNTLGSFRCYKALTCEPGYSLQEGKCTGEGALKGSSVPRLPGHALNA